MIIQLTRRNGESILVNTNIILVITKSHNKEGSVLEVTGRGQFGDIEVVETIEEIKQKLNTIKEKINGK